MVVTVYVDFSSSSRKVVVLVVEDSRRPRRVGSGCIFVRKDLLAISFNVATIQSEPNQDRKLQMKKNTANNSKPNAKFSLMRKLSQNSVCASNRMVTQLQKLKSIVTYRITANTSKVRP